MLGLVDVEFEYERAMVEENVFVTGTALRRFFVILLVNGAPGVTLWEAHRRFRAEHYAENEDCVYNQALLHLNRQLRTHGRQLSDYGLPDVRDYSTKLSRETMSHDKVRLGRFVEE